MCYIKLNIVNDRVYFMISNEKDIYASTSHEIATLLGIQTKYYNMVLIEKVIQHDKYYSEFLFNVNEEDVVFNSNGLTATTYIKRFKNAFCRELTSLELGGNIWKSNWLDRAKHFIFH